MREKRGKIIRRYSEALKRSVVEEIESCTLTVREAREYYNVPSNKTITRWVRQYGKEVLPTRMVKVLMKEEADQIEELKQSVSELRIENAVMRAQYEIILEKRGEEIKKKLSTKRLQEFESRHAMLQALWRTSADTSK